jgi:hypothetical protein
MTVFDFEGCTVLIFLFMAFDESDMKLALNFIFHKLFGLAFMVKNLILFFKFQFKITFYLFNLFVYLFSKTLKVTFID